MQVILQVDIPGVGDAGEVITVRDGFARNFLLPQGKAKLADPGNLKMLEHQRKVVAARQQKLKGEAQALADRLAQITIAMTREVGTEEKLFGAVTVKDIAADLKRQGFDIDRRMIKLDEPIKQLGEFTVPVRLHAEVTANIKVQVTANS